VNLNQEGNILPATVFVLFYL